MTAPVAVSESATPAEKPRVVTRRSPKQRVAEQAAVQGLVAKDGETLVFWDDVEMMIGALNRLANKALVKDYRTMIARIARYLREEVQDFRDEKAKIQRTVPPEELAAASSGVVSAAVIRSNREASDLGRTVVALRLPGTISEKMLPKNDADHPKNEDDLAAILADLGPLYPAVDRETPEEKVAV